MLEHEQQFALADGDVVCFYGDSITEQQLYTVFVEAFVATRLPHLNVQFHNRGWGGDTAGGSLELGGLSQTRVARDVKPLNPTVLTVLMGMNDGCYVPCDPEIERRFKADYENLIAQLRAAAPKAKLTLMQTPPWDDFAHRHPPFNSECWQPWHGYNDVLLTYGKVVKETAERLEATYADLNGPLVAALKAGANLNPRVAEQIIPDSIHPGPAGQLLMAVELLKAWKAPALVSEIEIDLGSQSIKNKGCTAGQLEGLSWQQTDESLPFAVDPNDEAIKLMSEISQWADELNRQLLKVHGLDEEHYQLLVDDQLVGTFSSEQFECGINLASFETPMVRQSRKVLELSFQRSRLAFFRWRQIETELEGRRSTARAAEGMHELEEELAADLKRTAVPVPHRFRLIPLAG